MEKGDTIGDVYRQASSLLGNAFEAELLLRKLLGYDRTAFYLHLQDRFPAHKWSEWKAWLKKRKAHQPIQYIVREQEFYGRLFEVDPSVLIPRPETEILVENVLAYLDDHWCDQSPLVVDIGTGSGAIAVSLVAEKPNIEMIAIDCSTDAIRIATQNAKRHGVSDRIMFRCGDFLTPLQNYHQTIDVIVSNPPYIPTDQIPYLEKQVRDYEPHLALDGGFDGLVAYRTILSQLRTWELCSERCMIAFEIGAEQKAEIVALIKRFFPAVEIKVVQDLAGFDRVILAELV